MKRQIRRGVFETNSSSTHSLTMCDEETFEKWKSGDLMFDKCAEEFIDSVPELSDEQKNEAKEYYEYSMEKYWKQWNDLTDLEKEEWYGKYAKEEYIVPEDVVTYDQFMGDTYLECFINRYTTKNGDKVVAFGQYGYEG